MRRLSRFLLCACLLVATAGGCVGSRDHTPESRDRLGADTRGLRQSVQLDRVLEERILALDPENVTERDITDVLSHGPTPRIINLRGGAPLVYLAMESFSNFLIGMGYPEDKIRSPRDGSYSYSSFKSSREIAGILAWYYEKEGMPPMLIGHSAGGMKAVKVLYELAGALSASVPVWNPLTEEPEERSSILDPRTGAERPVVGLTLGYATAVGSGGLASLFPASLFPNEWDMLRKRKLIPDTVEHFTGFYIQMDVIGGDMFGLLAEPNNYKANGVAKVRNVRLPFTHNHVTVPATAHLAGEKVIRDWLNAYTPTDAPELTTEFDAPTTNILWAADVWHSIKKQWCLEAQRAVRAERSRQKSP